MGDALDVYLTEYKCLKDEQRARIDTRDKHVGTMLTVVAAITYFSLGGPVFSFSAEASLRHVALFLLPPAGFFLGGVYLGNDEKVSQMRRYLRRNLTVEMECYLEASGLLGWEVVHRAGRYRCYWKIMQSVRTFLLFCAPGITAIIIYWAVTPVVTPLFTVISIVEVIMLLLLIVEILQYMDIARD